MENNYGSIPIKDYSGKVYKWEYGVKSSSEKISMSKLSDFELSLMEEALQTAGKDQIIDQINLLASIKPIASDADKIVAMKSCLCLDLISEGVSLIVLDEILAQARRDTSTDFFPAYAKVLKGCIDLQEKYESAYFAEKEARNEK